MFNEEIARNTREFQAIDALLCVRSDAGASGSWVPSKRDRYTYNTVENHFFDFVG